MCIVGLFERLFRKDPGAELDRADGLLAEGRAYEALQAAGGVLDASGAGQEDGLRERAREVVWRAREVLVGSALAEADRAEADGEYDDASDWVHSALEHLQALARLGREDGARQAELRRRLKGLRARGREAARQPLLLRRFEETGEVEGPDPLDVETRFGTLVGTLHEDVADLYFHRPLPFQQAYVDLNEGRLAEALAAFDALAAEDPDDPVVRLERGRCRLLVDDPAGAREDFEAAWPELGDAPLDPTGELSVPALWAHATMAAGDPATVADRLEPLAGVDGDDPELVGLRASALWEAGRPGDLEEARRILGAGVEDFPEHGDLPYLLAGVLRESGERARAIAVLETAVAPSCATGSCSAPPLHVGAVRGLVALYLEGLEAGDGGPSDEDRKRVLGRVEELLQRVVHAQGGQPSPPDRELLARYRAAAGDADGGEADEDLLSGLS